MMKRLALGIFLVLCGTPAARAQSSAPLIIGETFTIESRVMGETRRINVYAPPGYAESPGMRLPVLYMPDGGMAEDFLHVAGLVQVSVGNGTMRPFLLVGIENTQRRRDMTGPTEVARDRAIAPRVGGSHAFRRFIRAELMPQVRSRYRTTNETAIVGESLAGLFVVETLFLEPDLFDTYIAFDPSLWWNGRQLVSRAGERLRAGALAGKAALLRQQRREGDRGRRGDAGGLTASQPVVRPDLALRADARGAALRRSTIPRRCGRSARCSPSHRRP
jgi:predicted alpha/beta superfamily hydrolase